MLSPCLLLIAALASTTSGSVMEDMFVHEPRVQIIRKNALLPCTCTNGVLDCLERGKTLLTAEDLCHEPITTLDLYDNELVAVPDGFLGATVVNMSVNRLTRLPLPSQLNPHIEVLDLTRNVIANTSDELRTLRSLQTLFVSENYELRSLRFLPQPCALRHLKAMKIKLADIEGPLSQCTLLETLDLSVNLLSALPDTFSALTQLRELNLGGNALASLSNQTFAALTQLRTLELTNNGIRTLPDNIFGSLSNLKNLNLRGNALKTLPLGIFSSLSQLSHLNLVKNPLETFPEELKNVTSLEELNLALTGLTNVPDNAFSNLHKIKEIQLWHNNISSIPNNAFAGLSHLEAVTLTKNPLTSLQQGLFSDATNLKYVMLPCIGLNSDSLRVARNATHVIYAICGRIELSSAVFSALENAKWILFNQNKVTSIAEDAFVGLPLLRFLDLSDNGISDVPANTFSPLPQLQDLALASNRLSTIPDGLFSGLRSLKSLVLSHNRLTELRENVFHDLVSLESLDISINALTTLPPNLLAGLSSLKEVAVENNMLTNLPAYNPNWASVPVVSFSWNNFSSLDRATLRPWLEAEGSRGQPRHLVLADVEDGGPAPASLSWLLHEPNVTLASAGGSPRCGCGFARRGAVLMRICVNMQCNLLPPHPHDWLAAVVAADQATNTVPLDS